MEYFLIEGRITNEKLINDDIMKEHITYSKKAIDKGLILMSGLKSDMSGGLFVMAADSISKIEKYLSNEPLKVYGIQDYKVIKFDPHFFNKSKVNDLIENK